ncbi:MAG: M48 family metallopeptidase [Melioribacteraceae bacterium]|nr:M48 family metallopeptidase [Melioribacteraceae bacterium]
MTEAKKYNNIKLFVGIGKAIVSFILIFLFVFLGYSREVITLLADYTTSPYLQFLLFVICIGFISSVIFFPVKYYTEYYLEHKYNLSNQTIFRWLLEDLKGLLVGGIIGLPILLLFYYSLQKFQELWWLPFATLLFLVSVVLARIVPVIIMPIFYKITPLENENLKDKILALTKDVKINIENVYKFDMSKNTKKANAAFAGLGKTKRIILGDTLLDKFSDDEIETVIAHELGHYKYNHILKNIAFGTLMSYLTLFVIAQLYSFSLDWFGFDSLTDIAALPLLSLFAMLIGIITSPINSSISRKYEYQADEYAVKSTGKKEVFANTLEKLNEQNLGDKDPHPLVEWFFYSHPSIKNRIGFINNV